MLAVPKVQPVTLRKPTTYKKSNAGRRNVIVRSKEENTDRTLLLAEAISGRAATFGVGFGTLNWFALGLNVVEQIQQPPFLAGAVLAWLVSIRYMVIADQKLDEEQFERLAARREDGRGAMLGFLFMVIYSLSLVNGAGYVPLSERQFYGYFSPYN